MKFDFVHSPKMFGESHVSTIVETPAGLICAWFAGTKEQNNDVEIYLSHYDNDEWSDPVSVANGLQSDGNRLPCWNPVLFQVPNGPLMLFYKVGPACKDWWGEVKISEDSGLTWSKAKRLPDSIIGPTKNKPVLFSDGKLLCPANYQKNGWQILIQSTYDWGLTWENSNILNDVRKWRAVQPSILLWPNGIIQVLARTDNGVITQVTSQDQGKSWNSMTSTGLPNPNSGIDAVMLQDGRALLVYNHVGKKEEQESRSPSDIEVSDAEEWGPRSPLNVAVSDDGVNWNAACVLETIPGEFSYPAVIQTADGMVHITYTYKRETIKHVKLNPNELKSIPIVDGIWPESCKG